MKAGENKTKDNMAHTLKNFFLLGFCLLFALASVNSSTSYSAHAETRDFGYPIEPWNTTQGGGEFGAERSGNVYHLGDDVTAPAGTAIYAFGSGIVKHIGIHSRFGTVILIEHELVSEEKIVSLYGHLRMSDVAVSEGQSVEKGTLIGRLGSRGAENGFWIEHLHFGIHKGAYQKKWVYWGMSKRQEELTNWYNPSSFLAKNVKSKNVTQELSQTVPYQDGKIITGPGNGGRPHVRVMKTSGSAYKELDFFAYKSPKKAGADVAIGDLNYDGKDEIIVGNGPGETPEIHIFDKETGEHVRTFLAFDEDFKGGVRVATGDINNDDAEEIIVGAGPGGGAHVRVFDRNGTVIHSKLFPFGNQKTGVDVAAGDLNGDGSAEIIVSSGPGKEARITYYSGDGTLSKASILAFPKAFRGGAHVTAGDIDNDGIDEIIAGAGPGGGPQVRVFEADGTPRGIQFFPFHHNFRGGIDVASIDFDEDGKDEVVASQFSGGQSWIKVYRYNNAHTVLSEFIVYGTNFEGGTNVAGKR
ncbi:VCBS repeat domain-containing M23 family metallopeptidase [Patescibacteria group bacterium]|nr:VCBS repeat domain-containing M23 family metallopeptidase [Patescibacteria group bacterium]